MFTKNLNKFKYKKFIILIFLFYLIKPILSSIEVPIVKSDLPERKDYRELVTAIVALEHQIHKSMEHAMRSQIPGYIRPTYYITSKIDKDGLKEIQAQRRQKWISGRPIPTERPLDFCIQADNRGFFKLLLENGVIGYTRDGRFRIDYQQRLVTVAGNYPVLGIDGIIFTGKAQPEDITASKSGILYNQDQKIGKLDIAVFKNYLDLDTLSSLNGVIFLKNWEIPMQQGDKYYGIMQYNIEQSNTFTSFDSWFERDSFTAIANAYYHMIDADKQMIQAAAP
eukprot:COSAG01_NODE_69_length_28801_cov_10.460038_12_plen_281_part_00